MTNKSNELDWPDLLTMADEIKSDDGPGTGRWQFDGSATQNVNARVIRALRENGGTMPGPLGNIPCLILTTVGAKSGQSRAVPLFCLTVDGHLVIIGSMGGAKRNPPWFHNLLKNPSVSVEKDGEQFRATSIVTAGDERDYFFQKFCETYPIFSEYQAGINREIPIIELRREE